MEWTLSRVFVRYVTNLLYFSLCCVVNPINLFIEFIEFIEYIEYI